MRELAPLPVPLDSGEKTGRLLWLHRAYPSATLDKAMYVLISVILSFSTLLKSKRGEASENPLGCQYTTAILLPRLFPHLCWLA